VNKRETVGKVKSFSSLITEGTVKHIYLFSIYINHLVDSLVGELFNNINVYLE